MTKMKIIQGTKTRKERGKIIHEYRLKKKKNLTNIISKLNAGLYKKNNTHHNQVEFILGIQPWLIVF